AVYGRVLAPGVVQRPGRAGGELVRQPRRLAPALRRLPAEPAGLRRRGAAPAPRRGPAGRRPLPGGAAARVPRRVRAGAALSPGGQQPRREGGRGDHGALPRAGGPARTAVPRGAARRGAAAPGAGAGRRRRGARLPAVPAVPPAPPRAARRRAASAEQRPGAGRWKTGLLRTIRGTNAHRVRDLLPRVPRPTLLVVGREDRIVDPRQVIEAAGLLPQGRLTVLHGCGHAPQIEQADAVNRLVIDFLSEAWSPEAP